MRLIEYMTSSRITMFVCLVISGCSSRSDVKDEDPQSLRGEVPATEVTTVKAEIRPFEYLISTAGLIEASVEATVQSKASGLIERVLVKNNKKVSRGDLLVELNNTSQVLQLERANISLKEKQIIYTDQMLGYQQSLDSLRIKNAGENVRISSGLANAEITYKEAKLNLENTLIRAPVEGIISDLSIKPGNPISADHIICRIHNASSMKVECYVLEDDAVKISKGMRASVMLVTREETTYEAVVDEVNPRVDEKTKQVKIKLDLMESKSLLPGMHVKVIIRVPYKNNIIVPKEAIVVRSGRTVVFTMENNLAKWNYVTTGNENGKEIEILEGIKADSDVIITNNLQLAHDAPVSKSGRQEF